VRGGGGKGKTCSALERKWSTSAAHPEKRGTEKPDPGESTPFTEREKGGRFEKGKREKKARSEGIREPGVKFQQGEIGGRLESIAIRG